MHASIARIIGKPDDFIVCNRCGAINWYENDSCVQCGMKFTRIETSDYERILGATNLGRETLKHLSEIYADQDTEIDV